MTVDVASDRMPKLADKGDEYRLYLPVAFHTETGKRLAVPQKVLVTGTARSGTQWLTDVLRVALNLTADRCEHEPLTWRGYRDTLTAVEHIKNKVLQDFDPYVEVSCYANIGLFYWWAMGAKVIHITRDPYDTARSHVRTGFNKVGLRYRGAFGRDGGLGQMDFHEALDHWAEQHLRIMQWPVNGTFAIEDLWDNVENLEPLLDTIKEPGYYESMDRTTRRKLERQHKKRSDKLAGKAIEFTPPTREEIPGYIKALARDFGYDY